MIRVDAKDLRPSLSPGMLEVMINSLERLVDLLVDLGRDVVHLSLGVPSAWQSSAKANGEFWTWYWNNRLTLSGALNGVADSDGLAVRKLFSVAGAYTGVVVILEIGHGFKLPCVV